MVFSEFAKVRPWRVVASAMIICVLLWVAATIGPQAEGAGPSSAKVSARGDHVQTAFIEETFADGTQIIGTTVDQRLQRRSARVEWSFPIESDATNFSLFRKPPKILRVWELLLPFPSKPG